MNKVKQFFRNLIIKLAQKAIRKHAFLPTTLIRTRNGSGILEVEALMYDKGLEPVLIVKKYGGNGQLFSVSYPAVLEFVEHKGIAPSVLEVN